MHLIWMSCLAVDAHDWLGAGEADQHPAAVLQAEEVAVKRDQLIDFQSADGLWVGSQDARFAVFSVAFEGGVYAVVIVCADFSKEQVEQLGGFLAGLDHEIEQVQTRQDAIPLRYVAAEGIAAALLAADQGVGFEHLWGDIFEADAGLVDRNVIEHSQFVEHGGGGDGLDDRAALAAHFEQVVSQQGENAQLVDELAPLIAHPNPVGVAVGDDQHIGFLIQRRLQADVDVGRDGFGTFHFGERRVTLVV